MTMHMVHPGLTTINTKNKQKKPTSKQIQAKAEHDAWLRKQGIHPDQIAARSSGSRPKKLRLDLVKDRSGVDCSNGFAPGGYKKSVFDSAWNNQYGDDPLMAQREAAALREAEAKKANLMPLYNKGPVQYRGGLKMTDFGKRR